MVPTASPAFLNASGMARIPVPVSLQQMDHCIHISENKIEE
jgi:hypothetical protein